jgi:hypothetical protein
MIFSKKNFTILSVLFTFFLLITISRSAYTTNDPKPDFDDALFIAESNNILKVALADGRVLFEIPQAQ